MKYINFVGKYSLAFLKQTLSQVVSVDVLEDDDGYFCVIEDIEFKKISLVCLEENIKILISHNRDFFCCYMLRYCDYPANKIVHIADLIATNLNDEKVMQYLRKLFESIEPHLVYTVKMYMENNLNVVKTAKEIYAHRNTLNYRLNQFIEQTGVDIKDYKNMLLFYYYTIYCA